MGFNDFFAEVPRLETPRLVLRPFGREDMDSYLKWMQDPAVHRFLGGGVRLPQGEKQVSDWLKNINGRLLRSKTVLTWCAVCKKEDQVVGRVDLGGFIKKSAAELSCYFSAGCWGKGFASEAVREVTRFGFEELELHRIQALVLPENPASLRVLEKAGFQKEGLLKKYPFGREFHDAVILAFCLRKKLGEALRPGEMTCRPQKNAAEERQRNRTYRFGGRFIIPAPERPGKSFASFFTKTVDAVRFL